jgi:hypothetical protein
MTYHRRVGESLQVTIIRRQVMPEKTYNYHDPSSDGLARITKLRKAFSALHDLIEETAPASRERSVALTNLETTAMWAIKSVVTNDPDSTIQPLEGD